MRSNLRSAIKVIVNLLFDDFEDPSSTETIIVTTGGYTCKKCNKSFSLPWQFQNHTRDCKPKQQQQQQQQQLDGTLFLIY